MSEALRQHWPEYLMEAGCLGARCTELKGAVYIHPTLAEGFWTPMESVKPAESASAVA
jgi:hypothetical protein